MAINSSIKMNRALIFCGEHRMDNKIIPFETTGDVVWVILQKILMAFFFVLIDSFKTFH